MGGLNGCTAMRMIPPEESRYRAPVPCLVHACRDRRTVEEGVANGGMLTPLDGAGFGGWA